MAARIGATRIFSAHRIFLHGTNCIHAPPRVGRAIPLAWTRNMHDRTNTASPRAAFAPASEREVPTTCEDAGWIDSLGLSIAGHLRGADPFSLAVGELDRLTGALLATVRVLQHPPLDAAAAHLLSLHGKRVRPVIVILMAQAAAAAQCGAPVPILSSQRRLAEITELIHAASLLHDDVIDEAATRRGVSSANAVFGNQLAVLAGDFLLARASVALARLRNCDVVERLSTVIEHLVRGEVLQMRGGGADAPVGGIGDATEKEVEQIRYHRPENLFDTYLAKTFFKTASLIANSSRAVVMLGGHGKELADAAYKYGEHIGIAFQLVDDVLDMTASESALGKPVCDDLRQGHATAPVLFALESFPELGPMIERRFRNEGDVERAAELVRIAGGVERTRQLAAEHARMGVQAIVDVMPASEHRSALINLADIVLTRSR